MKIAVFSTNESFIHELQNHDIVEEVKYNRTLTEETIECDLVIATGSVVKHDEIATLRDKFPKQPIVYQLPEITSSSIMSNIETVCSGYNVTPLDEYLTVGQVSKKALKLVTDLREENTCRVYGFFGTHSGSGVSTTTMNVGKVLADSIQEKVLILSLNAWDSADYFTSYEGKYLDQIRSDLRNDIFNEESMFEATHKVTDNLYHLAGNRNIKMQRFYREKEIERLITTAKDCFDVILIDAGAHFDNAPIAQSFLSSDQRFLITTQEPKGYESYWEYVNQQIMIPLQKTADDFILLVNQYNQDINLITEKDLENRMEMNLLTSIPTVDSMGQIAISQRKLLVDLLTDKSEYADKLKIIVNSMVSRSKLTLKEGVITYQKPSTFQSILRLLKIEK